MAKNQPQIGPFLGGSDAYTADLEELQGDWNLHPALSVQERSDEWQRCFGSSISANPAKMAGFCHGRIRDHVAYISEP